MPKKTSLALFFHHIKRELILPVFFSMFFVFVVQWSENEFSLEKSEFRLFLRLEKYNVSRVIRKPIKSPSGRSDNLAGTSQPSFRRGPSLEAVRGVEH